MMDKTSRERMLLPGCQPSRPAVSAPRNHRGGLHDRGRARPGLTGWLVAALVLGTVISLPAAAKLFKWVDDNGVTHYGEVVPPEYANRNRSELDKSGHVVKEEDVLTPEQRHAKEQADEKKREEDQVAAEQQRRDRTLINTFSNAKEIDLARNRSLQQINAHIDGVTSGIKSATADIARLQKEADGYARTNRQAPLSLKNDLDDAKKKLDRLNKEREQALAEKAEVNSRYDSDKARYIELTRKN